MSDVQYVQGLLQDYGNLTEQYPRKGYNYSVVHVVPSVIPTFNPSYRIVAHDNGLPKNYTQYFCNLTYWNERGSRPQYEVAYESTRDLELLDMSVGEYVALAKRIVTDPIVKDFFLKWFYVGMDVPVNNTIRLTSDGFTV
jgi:hypothetical protein